MSDFQILAETQLTIKTTTTLVPVNTDLSAFPYWTENRNLDKEQNQAGGILGCCISTTFFQESREEISSHHLPAFFLDVIRPPLSVAFTR